MTKLRHTYTFKLFKELYEPNTDFNAEHPGTRHYRGRSPDPWFAYTREGAPYPAACTATLVLLLVLFPPSVLYSGHDGGERERLDVLVIIFLLLLPLVILVTVERTRLTLGPGNIHEVVNEV